MIVPAYLVGNLVADPEVKATSGGVSYCRFKVATNDRYKNAEGEWTDRETSYWSCEAWRETAVTIGAEFKKGSPVIVAGEFRTTVWKNEAGEPRSRQFVLVGAIGPNVLARKRNVSKTDAEAPAAEPDAASAWDAE